MTADQIRVGVLGALGKMGSEVVSAVEADDALTLACRVDPVSDDPAWTLEALTKNQAQVAIDFTHPDAVEGNLRYCIQAGIDVVVGTTGLPQDVLDELAGLAKKADVRIFMASNFAIGAVLMMRFAAEASKHLPFVEIIELHHDQKADAPSGTSLSTVEAIRAARGEDVSKRRVESKENIPGARGGDAGNEIRVHSVRLPSLVAHQEVLLSGPGESLTIRHDSTDRKGFMPGVVLAARNVSKLEPGLTQGLEVFL